MLQLYDSDSSGTDSEPQGESTEAIHQSGGVQKGVITLNSVSAFSGEVHSLFAKLKHAWPLAEFLRSQNVRFATDADAIEGEINFPIDKSTPWEEFVSLPNEWKRQYAEGSGEPAIPSDPLDS